MRRLFLTAIFVFTSCFYGFAQTNQSSPCPTTVLVRGPAGIIELNKSYQFTGYVSEESGKFHPTYKWTVSNGKTVEGQGTLTIKVVKEDFGETLTATLEVLGLPEECGILSASETEAICYCPSSVLLEEFTGAFSKIDQDRLKKIITALDENPNDQLYIVNRFKKNTSEKMMNRKEKELRDYFASERVDLTRITFVRGFGDREKNQFWLVPPGAMPPDADDK